MIRNPVEREYITLRIRKDTLRLAMLNTVSLLVVLLYPALFLFVSARFSLPALWTALLGILYTILAPALLLPLQTQTLTGAPSDKRFGMICGFGNAIGLILLACCIIAPTFYQRPAPFLAALLCWALLWLFEIFFCDLLSPFLSTVYFLNAGVLATLFAAARFSAQLNTSASGNLFMVLYTLAPVALGLLVSLVAIAVYSATRKRSLKCKKTSLRFAHRG